MRTRETTALIPWFGSSRMIGKYVGEELEGCEWVAVPFAGGMCELRHITARSLVVGDKHRHVMNLACVIAAGTNIAHDLMQMPFHPDTLKFAQQFCRQIERGGWDFGEPDAELDERWALNYFITQWMGRSGKAGTEDEFSGGLSTRWNANGGDSQVRYRSAVRGLVEWRRVMRRCNFHTMDAFEFLEKAIKNADLPGNGFYIDAPWPDDGDEYVHTFGVAAQQRLARLLARFEQARVVIRYGDHPLIRRLYQPPRWTCRAITGRTQANKEKAEVLIINGMSRAAGPVEGLFE